MPLTHWYRHPSLSHAIICKSKRPTSVSAPHMYGLPLAPLAPPSLGPTPPPSPPQSKWDCYGSPAARGTRRRDKAYPSALAPDRQNKQTHATCAHMHMRRGPDGAARRCDREKLSWNVPRRMRASDSSSRAPGPPRRPRRPGRPHPRRLPRPAPPRRACGATALGTGAGAPAETAPSASSHRTRRRCHLLLRCRCRFRTRRRRSRRRTSRSRRGRGSGA